MVVEGKQTYVHRLSWELANGEPLGARLACHTCDNPPCFNPEHLFAGTVADNNRDMYAKGRGVKVAPPAWRKVPLDELPKIIERYKAGDLKRDIAADYGVTRQAIHYLLRRENVA
jgi:hypothetical protein